MTHLPLLRREFPAPDEDGLNHVKRACRKSDLELELRLLALAPIAAEREDDGPYWARMLLCVDHRRGFVLQSPVLGAGDEVQDAFVEALEKIGVLPGAVRLTSAYLEAQLKGVTAELGIAVRRVRALPGVDDAGAALTGALQAR